jgi:hypothetical protein
MLPFPFARFLNGLLRENAKNSLNCKKNICGVTARPLEPKVWPMTCTFFQEFPAKGVEVSWDVFNPWLEPLLGK